MKKIFLLLILLTKLTTGVSYSQTTFIPTGATTIYDMQSMATPSHIVQDRNNPDYIHAVYMSSPYYDTTFTERTVKYLLSTDRGLTWHLVNNIPLYGTDFPVISLLSTGVPVISLNFTQGSVRKIISYVDVFPGLGCFISLGTPSCGGAFPVMTTSNHITQNNKFHILTSSGFTSALSVTNPSYTPCVPIPDIFGFSNRSSIAKSNDGRIGIAFISDLSPGDVFFMESEDNGESFGSAQKIFDALFDTDKSFIGALKGISLVYNNNTPHIVFDVGKLDATEKIYKEKPGGIMHWSSSLPGNDPGKCKYIARNDSNSYTNYIPFYKNYGRDELTSICRPSIGTFSDSSFLAVVFMGTSLNLKINGSDTLRYNNIYISYSDDKGFSWKKSKKLNPDGILKDWTYPSISPFNYSTPGGYYYANITCTGDSIPGSFVNNPNFGKSLAEQQYIKTGIYTDTQTEISTTIGTVSYYDNAQLVTNGVVKALRFEESTGQVLLTSSAPIDENGNYEINFTAQNYPHYIVAYPNSEPETDFVPTYYPSTVNWQYAETINSANNNSNIDIKVFRNSGSSRGNNNRYFISGVINKKHNSLLSPLNESYVYLKSGNSFIKFIESNVNGNYFFSALAGGKYKIIASKLGYSTIENTVNLINEHSFVNFELIPILKKFEPISNIIPEKYALYQNYPNPFNPVTNIKFDIPKASYVKINVYNVLGKEVSLLMSENKPAGRYSIDFDASSLTSGVYFYKIETGDFAETKRMVILK